MFNGIKVTKYIYDDYEVIPAGFTGFLDLFVVKNKTV